VVVSNSITNYFTGIVTAYNTGTKVMDVTANYVGGTGSFSTWNVNLQGNQGATGAAGTSGTSGTSGINGTSGTSGINGTSGTSGSSGSSGTSGSSGSSGTSGTSGIGVTGPTGQAGTPGTSTTTPYKVVVNCVGGNLNSITSFVGPTGTSVQNVGGWVASIPTTNVLRIAHTQGVPLVDVQALAINATSGIANMKALTPINNTAQYSAQQTQAWTQLNIYAASNSNAGYDASTGDWYILFFRIGQ
jgi:hypothetical protein